MRGVLWGFLHHEEGLAFTEQLSQLVSWFLGNCNWLLETYSARDDAFTAEVLEEALVRSATPLTLNGEGFTAVLHRRTLLSSHKVCTMHASTLCICTSTTSFSRLSMVCSQICMFMAWSRSVVSLYFCMGLQVQHVELLCGMASLPLYLSGVRNAGSAIVCARINGGLFHQVSSALQFALHMPSA